MAGMTEYAILCLAKHRRSSYRRQRTYPDETADMRSARGRAALLLRTTAAWIILFPVAVSTLQANRSGFVEMTAEIADASPEDKDVRRVRLFPF